MSPNEKTIDPQQDNIFSLIISGQTCEAYRLSIYDFQDELINSSTRIKTSTSKSYQVSSFNISQNTVITSTNDFSDGDAIVFTTTGSLPSPLSANSTYYIGDLEYGKFSLFTTEAGALDGSSPIDLTSESSGIATITMQTVLYDGETLEMTIPANSLDAGNSYKWQVELYANTLEVSTVSTSDSTMTIANHNLITGDIVYVQGDTIPSSLEEFTTYYVRKIDSNTIALFSNIEAARNNSGALSFGSTGSNVTISNMAISEEVVFLVYDSPTITFEGGIISQQSYTFKPIYSHPQGVMVSSFTAYIKSELDGSTISDSGLQENTKLEYTFDGLLSGSTYDIKFTITNNVNQTYSTDWTPFLIEYATPSLGINPIISNDEDSAAMLVQWSGIKQIVGEFTGEETFVSNFGVTDNTGIKIDSSNTLTYSNLNIELGSSPPVFWWNPISSDFTGIIMVCENTSTGAYIELGYDGVGFYRKINDILINSAPFTISSDIIYMIGLTFDLVIVKAIGNTIL